MVSVINFKLIKIFILVVLLSTCYAGKKKKSTKSSPVNDPAADQYYGKSDADSQSDKEPEVFDLGAWDSTPANDRTVANLIGRLVIEESRLKAAGAVAEMGAALIGAAKNRTSIRVQRVT
ncbi:uncharacterized protein LOC129574593 [Sitodiplosis mosellana]|uniref:uncharacterized protein LOC129574593 n=1 Tax=Sitodiplosis mosellana TaxID=263140 RepID=UPI002444550C|nr:uncharacterized protein LOC129574593 [Sitodiplosis mosellana]